MARASEYETSGFSWASLDPDGFVAELRAEVAGDPLGELRDLLWYARSAAIAADLGRMQVAAAAELAKAEAHVIEIEAELESAIEALKKKRRSDKEIRHATNALANRWRSSDKAVERIEDGISSRAAVLGILDRMPKPAGALIDALRTLILDVEGSDDAQPADAGAGRVASEVLRGVVRQPWRGVAMGEPIRDKR
jgi:hypothetical protein